MTAAACESPAIEGLRGLEVRRILPSQFWRKRQACQLRVGHPLRDQHVVRTTRHHVPDQPLTAVGRKAQPGAQSEPHPRMPPSGPAASPADFRFANTPYRVMRPRYTAAPIADRRRDTTAAALNGGRHGRRYDSWIGSPVHGGHIPRRSSGRYAAFIVSGRGAASRNGRGRHPDEGEFAAGTPTLPLRGDAGRRPAAPASKLAVHPWRSR